MDSLLNPIIKKYLGSIVRGMLMLGVPFLVSQGLWTPEEATATLTTAAVAITTLALSFYEKYQSQKVIVTAIAHPELQTQAAVERQIAKGPTPPVTVPKDVAPTVVVTRPTDEG